jgi:hypothetical protein
MYKCPLEVSVYLSPQDHFSGVVRTRKDDGGEGISRLTPKDQCPSTPESALVFMIEKELGLVIK